MGKTQDYGLGEFTFPRGWFMVADADEIKDRPVSVRFFAQDLVIYRGKSGRVVMLDAYCPHMGTHLGRNDTSYVIKDGQIEGDSIRCPYHAWRFGPDGKCNHIPYYDGPIPKAAAIRTYDDHRMAMCASLAAFNPLAGASVPVRVLDPGCVAKTYPAYFDDFFSVATARREDIPVITVDGPTAPDSTSSHVQGAETGAAGLARTA